MTDPTTLEFGAFGAISLRSGVTLLDIEQDLYGVRAFSTQPRSTTAFTPVYPSPDSVVAVSAARRRRVSIYRIIAENFGDDNPMFMGPHLCAPQDHDPLHETHILGSNLYKSNLEAAITSACPNTEAYVPIIDPVGPVVKGNAVRSKNTRFRPSYAVAGAASQLFLKCQGDGGDVASTRTSTGYRGNTAASSYRDNSIEPEHNSAVWIQNMPPNVTLGEVFGTIRTGAVHCLVLNPPTGKHHTCAAKLAFQSRIAAVEFIEQAKSTRGIVIGGRRLIVQSNRVRYPENQRGSRVVNIYCYRGQGSILFFEQYFQRHFRYELEVARQLNSSIPGVMILEFSFSSVRCQAAWAVDAINREPLFEGIFVAAYGRDPCAGI